MGYDKDESGKVKGHEIISYKHLVRALSVLSANLAFTKLAWSEALTGVVVERAEEVERVRRLKLMCRHVQQAKLRRSQPQWLWVVFLDLAAVHAGEGGDDVDAEEDWENEGDEEDERVEDEVEEEYPQDCDEYIETRYSHRKGVVVIEIGWHKNYRCSLSIIVVDDYS
eukprot:6467320-Amphidinium_carterae.1